MIVVVGLSHKTAPIGVREHIAIPEDSLRDFLQRMHDHPLVAEIFAVSTCNRVEIYAATTGNDDQVGNEVTEAIVDALAANVSATVREQLPRHMFRYLGAPAVEHLFRVAASLDSLVVGEAQVLGQVKHAFDVAAEAGTVGSVLGRAAEWSFHVAKRVRSETQVGAGSVSVSSVAVELARQIFGELEGRTAVLVGAGTMGEAAARHLCAAGSRILVVNRNRERADTLAATFHGSARSWDELDAVIIQSDVLIVSTGSPTYVITPDQLKRLRRQRKGRSLFIIDIAVPRNVDPLVNKVDGAYLYDIDDLSKIAGESMQERRREATTAEAIVAEEADAFAAWLDSLHVTPAIVAFRNQVRSVLDAELDRSLHGKLKHLDERDRKALEGMLAAAVNKLTHAPTVRLKSAAAEGGAGDLVRTLRDLFSLDGTEEQEPPSERPARSSRPPPQPARAPSDPSPPSPTKEAP